MLAGLTVALFTGVAVRLVFRLRRRRARLRQKLPERLHWYPPLQGYSPGQAVFVGPEDGPLVLVEPQVSRTRAEGRAALGILLVIGCLIWLLAAPPAGWLLGLVRATLVVGTLSAVRYSAAAWAALSLRPRVVLRRAIAHPGEPVDLDWEVQAARRVTSVRCDLEGIEIAKAVTKSLEVASSARTFALWTAAAQPTHGAGSGTLSFVLPPDLMHSLRLPSAAVVWYLKVTFSGPSKFCVARTYELAVLPPGDQRERV